MENGEWVLVVDDSEDMRGLVALLLQDRGYHTEQASGVAAAQLKIKQHRFKAVVTDYMMEDGNGLAVLDAIVELPLSDRPRAIMMSDSHAYKWLPGKAKEHGARAFLSKPFGMEELSAALEGK